VSTNQECAKDTDHLLRDNIRHSSDISISKPCNDTALIQAIYCEISLA